MLTFTFNQQPVRVLLGGKDRPPRLLASDLIRALSLAEQNGGISYHLKRLRPEGSAVPVAPHVVPEQRPASAKRRASAIVKLAWRAEDIDSALAFADQAADELLPAIEGSAQVRAAQGVDGFRWFSGRKDPMLDLEHMIRQEQIERVASTLRSRLGSNRTTKPWGRLTRQQRQVWLDHAEAVLTATEEARLAVIGSVRRKPRTFAAYTSQP